MKPVSLHPLALALLLPLAACGHSNQTDSQPATAASTTLAAANGSERVADSWLAGKIGTAMQEAKQELATKNIDVNAVHVGDSQRQGKDPRPKAEITPQGDLLIAGQKVAATPPQQALLRDYRSQIVGIAEAGMDIGTQGADLGLHAAKEALWGKLSGKSDKDIEQTIQPQAEQIKAAAVQLCRRLPGLLSAQQQLAAAMPEFRPYATMQQKDVDDCGKHVTDKDGKKGFAVFSD